MAQRRCMVLHKEDDVAVLLEDGQPEDWIEAGGSRVALKTAVPKFHKIALRAIAAGEAVRKAGEVIGVMTRSVEPGDYVHVHNIKSQREGAANLSA
jgi:altronate dehydratase